MVALLRARDISEVSRALALDLIEEHVVRQSAMLHGLWDASRLAVGALALQCRPLSLGELVSACTDALKPAATAAEVSLRSRVDAQVVVSGDERWLMHVVMNLLSNALKFTAPRGAIDVDVGVTGQRANLRIADTGRGIAKATLERIFDGPWDIHEANRAPHEKAGLGLFLVRKLVTLHGGEIHAQSDGIGHGSTFRLCLPLSSVDVGL
ncbi:MAG: HAMP domain-containing histidine kinase [Polyangiaceae bacterium]|nr:HAMP domain-containing histidine kinase [Polyangiaceae bacterium]